MAELHGVSSSPVARQASPVGGDVDVTRVGAGAVVLLGKLA